MSTQRPKSPFTVEEALEVVEEDAGRVVCLDDSSSDDEDLLHPNTNGDSDYCLPSSDR